MVRRLAGIVVVVLAVIGVLAISAVQGRRMSGSAVALTFPAPPQVGDCLLSLASQNAIGNGPLAPEIPVTAISLGSCEGPILGEVVALWNGEMDAANAPHSRSGGPCDRQAAEFSGVVTVDPSAVLSSVGSGEPVVWKPTIAFVPYRIVPGPAEQRAGRSWSACVVVPLTVRPYRGSLRNAFTTGSMPAEFGSCWTSANSGQLIGPGDCSAPHSAQLLSTGWAPDSIGVLRPVVDQSCERIAGRLMHAADPTRAGELLIQTGPMTQLAREWHGSPSSIGCLLTTTQNRRLTGSLIGLGEQPIPYAR